MSKEFKHTPGPHHCHWDADDKTVAFVSGNGAIIAEMVGPDQHRRANAKLFSSSLDLLKVTEVLVRCIKDALQDDSIDASTEGGAILNGDIMRDALNAAQLAIAKARGE